LTASLAAAAAE